MNRDVSKLTYLIEYSVWSLATGSRKISITMHLLTIMSQGYHLVSDCKVLKNIFHNSHVFLTFWYLLIFQGKC